MTNTPPTGNPVGAFAAYFRSGHPASPHPSNSSGVVEHDGKQYVVLHNVNGVLAVYRILTSGALKRLKRWPTEIAKA
jgi:hypothetical protein